MASSSNIERLIKPIIETMGYALYGLDMNTGGRRMRLKVFVEKLDGAIVIDECAHISRRIGAVLDAEEIIHGEYILEVSSPGIDRPLFTKEHIIAQCGKNIAVQCREAIEGRKNFKGLLTRIDENAFVLLTEEKEDVVIPFEEVVKSKVILDIHFGTKPK